MTGLVKKLSREKLESERCWMISDSAKSPAEEELAGWKKGNNLVYSKRYTYRVVFLTGPPLKVQKS